MPKNLIIVESPAKARTIKSYLGNKYEVKSSFGHIRDLPKKDLNIDVNHDFTPSYEISPEKKKVVADLKRAAKGSEVWLASDEDREGEAIAWHLSQAMKLDPAITKRIVFHEITKPAIEYAIKHPRTIDLNLVDSYQARRVLDRLVGYEISPVLWRKVRPGLSAGRVQSVGVRLVVEREREINAFKPIISFKISAVFDAKGSELIAELNEKFTTIEQARQFLTSASKATFHISAIEKKPASRNPSAPFTTSTLQQEAARRLGFGVRHTMSIAQRLYENGHITYMRTDSTTLSGLALSGAESYIKEKFGQIYHDRRQYKTKVQNAQEAHEAIRPTNFNKLELKVDSQEQKLYNLIWQRALASQMAAAKLEKTNMTINVSNRKEEFIAKGEILKSDGFLKVYGGSKEDTLLPSLTNGQSVSPQVINGTETFSHPPARYSEASLVKRLEELGIGRPSTYATIISTIQSRGYVEKSELAGIERTVRQLTLQSGKLTETTKTEITGADSGKFVPISLGEVTTDFITKYFPSIADYDFTANTETEFDRIASGREVWNKMVGTFYKNFHPLVKDANEASRKEVSQAKLIGTDPKTKQSIYARFGRYGPILQRGETEDEDKPAFAPLPIGAKIETVTLNQALEMFKLPRLVGKTAEGEDIKANIGRFGPYIQVNKVYVSIEPLDPKLITEAEARKLYEAKLKRDSKRIIRRFSSGIQVLNGPYGPYVSDGKKNARLSKELDPKKLTEAESKALLEKISPKKRHFRSRRSRST
ncbi:MAG: type I DNA topoisomerase [Candidatus Saccharimonadales bacterium]